MKQALVVLAVLPLIASCGGSGGAAKAAYVKKAEAICTVANKARDALKAPTDVSALAPFVDALVAIADTATTGLGALTPPSGDVKDLQAKVLGPLQAQLAAGHEYAAKVTAATKAKDRKALSDLVINPPTKTRADLRWMKQYGFHACVKAADTSS